VTYARAVAGRLLRHAKLPLGADVELFEESPGEVVVDLTGAARLCRQEGTSTPSADGAL